MNDILFNKVFQNKYLNSYIFKSINNNNDNSSSSNIGYMRPFNEIKSLKWMIKNKEYNLLVDKLISGHQVIIDLGSLETLINECKDFNVFKIIFEKKRDILESISRDLLLESIKNESLFALESFIKLYELYDSIGMDIDGYNSGERNSSGSGSGSGYFNYYINKFNYYFSSGESKVKSRYQLINQDYYQYLIKYSLAIESYGIVEFLINKYKNDLKLTFDNSGEWRDSLLESIFNRKNFNMYVECIVDKMGFNLDLVVKKIYKSNRFDYIVADPITKFTNKVHLLSFLNHIPHESVSSFISGLKANFYYVEKFYIKSFGLEELQCTVYLLLFMEYYDKSKYKFNQEVTKFENQHYTMDQILVNYSSLLGEYCISYYFNQQQYDKLNQFITNQERFMQLVILSNINFDLEGIRVCSEFKQFKFDSYIIKEASFIKSIKRIEDEDQVINFYNYIKQFENRRELLLTRYYSSYPTELYLMSDYYTYYNKNSNDSSSSNNNSSNNNSGIGNSSGNNTDDILFSFQPKSIDSYNDEIIRAIILDNKPKEINIKLLVSIISRINNLNSTSKEQLLKQLLQLNNNNDSSSSSSSYRDQCIGIWYNLYKNQLFKSIKYKYQIKWIRLLYSEFKIDDKVLSTITELCMNQIKDQLECNEIELFNSEVDTVLMKYVCANGLYNTFKVLLNVIYPNQYNRGTSDKLEYEMYFELKQQYFKSLPIMQKFKLAHINEEIINGINQDQLFSIYNRRDIYNQFLSNANNHQVGILFKRLNDSFSNKREILIADLLNNDRFEVAIKLFGNQVTDLNSIIEFSIHYYRFDIVEYYLNHQLFNIQTQYTLDQLYDKSKNNDIIVLFKLLLNHFQDKLNINHKLVVDLVSFGSYNCYSYIIPVYNLDFTLKNSDLKIYNNKRSNYQFKKLLLKQSLNNSTP